MRLLVCGDRNWSDIGFLYRTLDYIHNKTPITVLIEGECRGADIMGRNWAKANGVTILPFPADWKTYGKSAGPIRNREMLLKGKPDRVVAFHDDIAASRGTKDMITLAKQAQIPTEVFAHEN